MNPGDPESSTLRNLGVLKNDVSQFRKEKYLDPNPRVALEKMQTTNLGNIIHEIGSRPFFVLFWMLA